MFGPEHEFPYAPERKYTPCDAPKEKLFALRDFLGFDKNVIVQASCHSKDNRAMVDALDASNGRAKGVAFVGEEVTDDELKWMDRAGVRGVRFNFIKRLVDFTPRDVLQRIAARVAQARLAHRGLFRDAGSAGAGRFLHLAADHRGGRSHGHARRARRASTTRRTSASTRSMDKHKNFWVKVTCPERMSPRRPAL